MDLTNLPSTIEQIAILDIHDKIRAFKPLEIEPTINIGTIDSFTIIQEDNGILEIATPIYYNSNKIGTLWMLYNTKNEK